MAFINWITENIILPVSDIMLNQSVTKYLMFLQKSQYWSKSELEEYQNAKLVALISHSYNYVPYYNYLFRQNKLKPSDIRNKSDLWKIPILTKENIRKNKDKLIAKSIKKRQYLHSGSSGSTGEPLEFLVSKESYSINVATNLRGWYWSGYRLGDKFIKLSVNPRKGIKKLQDFITRNKYLYAEQLNDENFARIVKEIINYKPSILRGYPTPLLFLVNYANKNNIDLPKLKAINTTGSILYPELREIIEKAFDCKIFDSYSGEGGACVFECSNRSCYHSSMEYAITEIVDENGNPSQKGKVITTDLWNYVMPFIRYDTQDIIELSDNECSCGRNLLQVKRILGRDTDVLVTPKGKYLILHNFGGYFKQLKEVEQFQVRQEKIDRFDIYLTINSNNSSEIRNEVYNYWKNFINEEVQINIKIVDEIPLTKSGKRRYVIRSNDIPLRLYV